MSRTAPEGMLAGRALEQSAWMMRVTTRARGVRRVADSWAAEGQRESVALQVQAEVSTAVGKLEVERKEAAAMAGW
eukprot:2944709-Prymnesium_polylepis.1